MLLFDGVDSYHFWPIFQEFLMWVMHQKLTDAEQHSLYSRGALFYELHDEPDRALECYSRAGDQSKVSALLVKNAEQHPGVGYYLQLQNYYFALPNEEILKSPSLMCGMKLSVDTVDNSKLTETQKATLGVQTETAFVVDVNVYVNGTRTSTFGDGKITISVPYILKSGENAYSITVWFINDDGTIEPKTASYANGKVTFTTEHLSQYLIVDFPFTDVTENSWCYGSVAYAYNNGLFSGTSASTFSPNATANRQMIWMILARMELRAVESLDRLVQGAYGILEPAPECPRLMPDQVDFAVLPCLSCSRAGHRLGKGGGYYDRFLAAYRGSAVLLCREQLLREDIPVEPHDMSVPWVVTESGLYEDGVPARIE